MNRYKKWFNKLIICTLISLLTIACFNYLINPYNVFQAPVIKNINENKIETKEYLKKARDLVKNKPEVLFLGSSRTGVGLDPSYYYEQTGETAYNLGLSGSNMYEQRRYFEYALSLNSNLKKVIIGLDFEGFNEYRPNSNGFSEERLNTKYFTGDDLLVNLLSYNASKNSIEILYDNISEKNNFTNELLLPDGSHNEGKILANHSRLLGLGRNRFYEHINEQLVNNTVLGNYELSKERLNDFQIIINLCLKHDIDLISFIHPVHAIQLEGIYKAGLWMKYEEWKQEIIKITPIWDFSGYNSITTSPPTNFNSYLDQSHYRKWVGNMVLYELLNPQNRYSNFGRLLSNGNIDEILANNREERLKWEASNIDIVNNIIVP